nr:S-layer family protein [Arthrospira sp. SH-MAG29]
MRRKSQQPRQISDQPEILGLMACAMYFNLCTLSSPAQAQIRPDRTLPQNSIVTPQGNIINIEGGTVAGNNLFHSFGEFSLTTGSVALFNNSPDIQNIISRVTGGMPSNIDGLIQANGVANLFLLNPNGIIFGANAQLNIGGSFLASTAERLIFDDGTQLSTQPQLPPLLSINTPIGLQLNGAASTITNRSQAVGIGLEGEPSPTGLQVQPGQSITLVGGQINLEGGHLSAFGGNIELAAMEAGIWQLQAGVPLNQPTQPGDIQLTRSSSVTTSGLGRGNIRLTGRNINLTGNSRLTADTFGDLDGGGVTINANQFNLNGGAFISAATFGEGDSGGVNISANESVNLTGTQPSQTINQIIGGTFNPLEVSGGVFTFSANVGRAGDVNIITPNLNLDHGASVVTATFVAGPGGDINIRADRVGVLEGSLLLTGTNGLGNAGNVDIISDRLQVINDGFIATSPGEDGSGRGGNLTVRANTVELRGVSSGVTVPGGLFSATLGSGDAGDLTIHAQELFVADGTQVSTSAAGAGKGGNLTVNADTIELVGISPDGRFLSGLLTSSALLTVQGIPGTSPAGDLNITARRIVVRDGAQISSATGSEGRAGELNIRASESVEVIGVGVGVDPSVESVSFGVIGDGIVPSSIESNTSGEGAAGDLQIVTDRLVVRDGAEIGVRGTGEGAAGNLNIQAGSIWLDNQGTLSAATAAGSGGNISLVTPRLEMFNGSRITTNAGSADGGNISIITDNLIALENSDITANAQQGRGGRVTIEARGIFGTAFRERETPASDITATSELGAEFSGAVEITSPEIDPNSGLVTLPTDVIDPSRLVVVGCSTYAGSEFVVTGRGGLPPTPSDNFTGDGVLVNWIDAVVSGNSPTAINPNHRDELNSDSKKPVYVEAQGLVFGADGRVQLVANPPEITPYPLGMPACGGWR